MIDTSKLEVLRMAIDFLNCPSDKPELEAMIKNLLLEILATFRLQMSSVK